MEISLKNISYYEDGRHVLKDVSCILFPNQVTCVMGMSGSGTVCNLNT
jgi:ABC-type phosphate transport system ATPase subunit